MGKSSGSGGTQTTQTILSEEQKALLRQQQQVGEVGVEAAKAVGQEFLGDTPEFFPGQITQPFDPLQQQAQSQQIDLANLLQGVVPQQAQQAVQFGLEGVLDPNNPILQAFTQSALDPVIQNFTERVLPNLGSAAQQAGAFGGSRQGQLEAGLSRDLVREMGNITAGIQADQFGQGLDVFSRTQALLPQLIQSQFLPSQMLGQVGAERQLQGAAQTAEDVARFDFGENITGQRLAQLSNILGIGGTGSGGFGPSGSVTSTSGGGGGGLLGGLGGAVTGAGAFGSLSQVPAFAGFAAANPWIGGAMVGLGALSGLFG